MSERRLCKSFRPGSALTCARVNVWQSLELCQLHHSVPGSRIRPWTFHLISGLNLLHVTSASKKTNEEGPQPELISPMRQQEEALCPMRLNTGVWNSGRWSPVHFQQVEKSSLRCLGQLPEWVYVSLLRWLLQLDTRCIFTSCPELQCRVAGGLLASYDLPSRFAGGRQNSYRLLKGLVL